MSIFPGFGSLSERTSKILDPGGFLAEKVAPKELKPYASLRGTNAAMKESSLFSEPASTAPTPAPASSRSGSLLT